jgi:hypothetical protein
MCFFYSLFLTDKKAAYGYRDFETVFTVQIALSMNSISRLSDTWRNLDSKARQQWHVINKFASYEGNYKTYRQKLKNIFRSGKYPNIMPYMGIYLRDLAGLEEGSVNFEKGGAGILF